MQSDRCACAWAAGALTALLDIQSDPAQLSHLIISLITAAATGRNDASPAPGSNPAGTASAQLPSEAQPLMRLLAHAQRHLGMATPPETSQQHNGSETSSLKKGLKNQKVQPLEAKVAVQPAADGKSTKASKQKRKRDSASKQGSPDGSRSIQATVHADGIDIEEGLSKKLKLNPTVEVKCDDGPWETQLHELSDAIANTG